MIQTEKKSRVKAVQVDVKMLSKATGSCEKYSLLLSLTSLNKLKCCLYVRF